LVGRKASKIILRSIGTFDFEATILTVSHLLIADAECLIILLYTFLATVLKSAPPVGTSCLCGALKNV